MAPMVRIDHEVYEYLNQRGRTEDSFNDVIRRELGLPPKRQPKALSSSAGRGPDTEASDVQPQRLEEALDRLLPPYWSATRARRTQIREVALAFLRTPPQWTTEERHLHAARQVASAHGIEVTTVHDKCGRQLYGTGSHPQIGQFRMALLRLEEEMGGRT